MKRNTLQSLFVTAVLTLAGVGFLVQCAPKKSEAPSAGKQEKVDNMSNLTEGIAFKDLEGPQAKDKAAMALYEDLKKKSVPNAQIIVLAIAEQHLKAAGKDSSNETAMKLAGTIADYAQKSKITKMEELRNVYDTMESTLKRAVKTGNRENSLANVMEKGEITSYSAAIWIASTWLYSSINTAMPVVIISNGSLEIGEVRADQKLVSFNPGEKGTTVKELGKLEEVAKTKRIIPLKLFLIHEALKSYAVNPVAWATKVLASAATELKIKLAAEFVVNANTKVDAAKIEESALLLGRLTELSDSELLAAGKAKDTAKDQAADDGKKVKDGKLEIGQSDEEKEEAAKEKFRQMEFSQSINTAGMTEAEKSAKEKADKEAAANADVAAKEAADKLTAAKASGDKDAVAKAETAKAAADKEVQRLADEAKAANAAAAKGTPGATSNYEYKVNGKSHSVTQIRELLRNLDTSKLLGFFRRYYANGENKALVRSGDSIVLARVSKMDETQRNLVMGFSTEVKNEFQRILEFSKKNPDISLILVQIKNTKGTRIQVAYDQKEEGVDKPTLHSGKEVNIKPEFAEALIKMAQDSKPEDNNLLAIEIVSLLK